MVRPRTLFATVLLAGAVGLGAQEESGSLFRGFELSDAFVLSVDDTAVEGVAVYVSPRIPAFLLLGGHLEEGLLLVPRSASVLAVEEAAVRREGEAAELEPAASPRRVATIETRADGLRFVVDDTEYVLADRPPLLGELSHVELLRTSSAYARTAAEHLPSAGTLQRLDELGEAGEVEVEVFFGSWCGFCGVYVPRVLKVAQLTQSVRFVFFGLPKNLSADPRARAHGVTAVPTGVVRVDSVEVGRLLNDQWRAPEEALVELLEKALAGG